MVQKGLKRLIKTIEVQGEYLPAVQIQLGEGQGLYQLIQSADSPRKSDSGTRPLPHQFLALHHRGGPDSLSQVRVDNPAHETGNDPDMRPSATYHLISQTSHCALDRTARDNGVTKRASRPGSFPSGLVEFLVNVAAGRAEENYLALPGHRTIH